MGVWIVGIIAVVAIVLFGIWDSRYGSSKIKREIWDLISEEQTAKRKEKMLK